MRRLFRWKRAPAAADEVPSADVEQFHRGVMACIDALGRDLPQAGSETYNLQVFTVALAVNLRVAASRCLQEGHMTPAQLRLLLQPLLQDLGGEPSADNSRQ